MPRVARIINPGYPHHITQRGNNKQLIFRTLEDGYLYIKLLKKHLQDENCRLNAYCLMPNHIHLLLIPEQNNSLSKAMHKISLSYTRYINKKYDRTGRLWESRFFSSTIDRETYLWAVCRYIEQNPLRAGLTDNPFEYRWSSAKINAGLVEPGFLKPVWEEYLDNPEYSHLLIKPLKKETIEKIRKNTSKGTPLGSKEFLNKMSTKFGKKVIPRPRGNPRKKSKPSKKI